MEPVSARFYLGNRTVFRGRGHRDKALAALGKVRAAHEVHLTAGTAVMQCAQRFRTNLTKQVNLYTGIHGNEVVMLTDD